MYKGRIQLLDFARALAVIVMIHHHFVYDLALFGMASWDYMFSMPMEIVGQLAASTFIFVSGFSSRLSRNNLKRGAMVYVFGLVVSLCSSFAGVTIRFGILEFLGSSMMLYSVLGKYFDKLPRGVLPALCIPLFCGTYYMFKNVYFPFGWLYPFGFRGYDFVSADYFPLLPWFCVFLMGAYIGGKLMSGGKKAWMEKEYPRPLTYIGSNTLIIYLAHQPVLYGAVWILSHLVT